MNTQTFLAHLNRALRKKVLAWDRGNIGAAARTAYGIVIPTAKKAPWIIEELSEEFDKLPKGFTCAWYLGRLRSMVREKASEFNARQAQYRQIDPKQPIVTAGGVVGDVMKDLNPSEQFLRFGVHDRIEDAEEGPT